MNKIIMAFVFAVSVGSSSHAQADEPTVKSTIKCAQGGCSIVCHQPGNRWDTFLRTMGDIEVTNFTISGNIRYKAPVEGNEYAILETNPNTQFCRITGVAE
ncbi:hypothetical protein [Marinicella sp. W31]|uniref:hypothetical protein n=1 Tax=Marinicella sp. W31 TaxID=3023713 RepID=UPI0037565337